MRTTVFIPVALAGLLLAGCEQKPQPGVQTAPSPTLTPNASPSAAAARELTPGPPPSATATPELTPSPPASAPLKSPEETTPPPAQSPPSAATAPELTPATSPSATAALESTPSPPASAPLKSPEETTPPPAQSPSFTSGDERPTFSSKSANEYVQSYDAYINDFKLAYQAMRQGDMTKYQAVIQRAHELQSKGEKLGGELSPEEQARFADYLNRKANELAQFANQNH
jgi:hypothetical protein